MNEYTKRKWSETEIENIAHGKLASVLPDVNLAVSKIRNLELRDSQLSQEIVMLRNELFILLNYLGLEYYSTPPTSGIRKK